MRRTSGPNYEWIRLHSGIMPGGLCDLVLQKTKRYTFQMISLRPIVRELTYENVMLDDKWPCSATTFEAHRTTASPL